jgi:rSAM/selenodomain-associated transferase 2
MKRSVSIIIPVFNETHIISESIQHIHQSGFGEADEIIVVDGSTEANTIVSISQRWVRKVSSPKGRGVQMNCGAKMATGDILLFLHADTHLVSNALPLIKHTLNHPRIVGGAFDLGIQSDRVIYRLIEKMASLRSRITRIPYGDQAIFIEKSFFTKIGGYRDIPIMEDVELMKRVKSFGGKIRIIRSPVMTSPRRWEAEGVVFGTLRNWMLISLYSFGVDPKRLARFYQ